MNKSEFLSLIKETLEQSNKLDIAKKVAVSSPDIYSFYDYDWDQLAFGMHTGDEITLNPNDISIKYQSDIENATYRMGAEKKYGPHFKEPLAKLPPVEVKFDGNKYYLEDGHHRYILALRSNQDLKATVELDANPFLFIGIDNPSTFYKQNHKTIKPKKAPVANEELYSMVREEMTNIKRGRTIVREATGFNSKTIVNVDIQPEYQNGFSFKTNDWARFLNTSSRNNRIIFLYNGADTLGMISEGEYIQWLLENGVKESVIDGATFYDKGYAFFRYCMDESIDERQIVNLIKFMRDNNVNDSRDMTEKDLWGDFIEQYGDEDIKDLLEFAGDAIHIPDLMDFLSKHRSIVLTGGGVNECLKEVEIALMALNQPYEVYKNFTY